MKIFTYLLTAIAIGLIIYNATKIDLSAPLQGDSTVALITIFAALCAIVLLQILRLSKKVEKQSK